MPDLPLSHALRGAALGLALLGCDRPPSVAVSVQVVIPADVGAIAAGELHLRLWSYDPGVTDPTVYMIGLETTPFSHVAGERQVIPMRVAGRPLYGERYYIRAQGCAGEDEVLWDGLVAREAPREVVMHARATPAPCSTSEAALP